MTGALSGSTPIIRVHDPKVNSPISGLLLSGLWSEVTWPHGHRHKPSRLRGTPNGLAATARSSLALSRIESGLSAATRARYSVLHDRRARHPTLGAPLT